MSAPDAPAEQHDKAVTHSLDAWFERDAKWLEQLLSRSLRLASAEAEDIAQDTWLRIARLSPGEISHPRAFLSRIALNLFRDRRRREKVRQEKFHLLAANDIAPNGPERLQEQEVEQLLEQIIVDLPQPLRDVFLLSRFRRMTNHDIAQHLGISVKTVEWRIGKAMEHCMTKLRG